MKRIFVLTGAGISAESGMRTYRSDTGLWEEHKISEIATPEGFARNPGKVIEFYDARYRDMVKAEPNAAHVALAELEADPRFHVTIVTQNIDDLHERAGSKNVIHMHGRLGQACCATCGAPIGFAGSLAQSGPCGMCSGRVRPFITWFGEMPKRVEEIEGAFLQADAFWSIGTSGEVWPAAGYARRAKNRKYERVELNLRETEVSPWFRGDSRGKTIRGPASLELPEFIARMLAPEPSGTTPENH